MNRKRVFFGWWVLTGGTLIYSVASGTVINTLPMFYPYLMEEFGWGSEQVTRSATVFFILGAFCTPPISYLLDRYSVRRVMLLSICVFSAAFLSYRLIDSLASMTTVYIVFAVSLVGCAVVPNMVLISRWFHRHRGIAVGILLTGSSIAGAVFPLFVKGVIDNGGSWRDAVTFLAVIGTLVMLFSVVFLVRNRPQDLGLAPDGIESGITKEAEETTEPGKTFTGALKTRTFYLLAFINCSIWFCVMTVLQHQAIYLDTELGVTSKDLPLVFSLFFWCAVVGKLAFGWLSDHYNKVLIMFAAVFCLTAGLLLLRAAHADRTFLLAYAVVFGAGFSGAFTMVQLLIAKFFSGRSFGSILGFYTAIEIIAGAIGVQLIGRINDNAGSYLPAFAVLEILGFVVLAVILLLYVHSRKARPST